MKRNIRLFLLLLFLPILLAGHLNDRGNAVQEEEIGDVTDEAVSPQPEFQGHYVLDLSTVPDNSYERPAPLSRIVCFSRNLIISFIFKEIAYNKICRNREYAVGLIRSCFQSRKTQWGYYTVGLGKLRF